MPSCVAVGCGIRCSDKSINPPLTFHQFPNDGETRKKWVQAVRKNWKPSKRSRICSKHFKEDDFDRSPFYNKLKKGAVPSILDAFREPSKPRSTSKKLLSDHEDYHPDGFSQSQNTDEAAQSQPRIKVEPGITDNFYGDSSEDFIGSASQSSFTLEEPPAKKAHLDPVARQNELLEMACSLLSASKEEESNECLDIGKVWGTKLMSLDPLQRKFAEKAINDILFEADLGMLNRDSVQINVSPNLDPLENP